MLAGFALLVWASFGSSAKASTLAVQGSGGTNCRTDQVGCSNSEFQETWDTATDFSGSDEKISSVSFRISLHDEDNASPSQCWVAAQIQNEVGTTYTSNKVYFPDIIHVTDDDSHFDEYFNFDPNSTIDLTSHQLKKVYLVVSKDGGTEGNCNAGGGSPFWLNKEYSANDAYSGASFGSGDVTFSIFGNSGQNLNTNATYFNDPPFTEGFLAPDFNNWWTCQNFVTGGSGANSYYWFGIYYGTSTLESYFDDSRDMLGTSTPFYLTVGSLPYNACNITSKSQSLTEDSWQAQVGLYRHSAFTGDNFIASSSVLHFTVTSGTVTDFPNQEPLPEVHCSFDVSNTGVSAVDDVVNGLLNGGCKVLRFLFVPNQNDFTRFSNLWTSIKSKPPFGYFTLSASELSGLNASSTPSSTPPSALAYVSGFTTPIDYGLAFLAGGSFLLWGFYRLKNFHF